MRVLSIGMLNAGDEDYYLSLGSAGPARADEYYSEGGTAPGVWMGAGSPTLGLSGPVDPAELRAVLAGLHPSDGSPMVAPVALHARRRPGLFLTFSAPKGVSLIAALGDARVAGAVEAAHGAAVADAVAYLEGSHLHARRGRDGVERVATGGMVAAGFVHHTSRAGDPQLHTHVLVANLVQGADGRWSAPDSRSLFKATKTAGHVYQAALRAELTARLGLGWGPVRNGMAEPAGIDPRALRAFSIRRRQIEASLERAGQSTAASAQVAAYRTRPGKDTDISPAVLAASWAIRAEAVGLDRAAVATLVGHGRTPVALDVAGLADRLLAPTGLTATRSSFTRADVVRAVADAAAEGATAAQVERAADAILADSRVRLLVPTPNDADPAGGGRQEPGAAARFTTTELLAVETRVLCAAASRTAGWGAVPVEVRQAVLADHPTLTAEQRRAVARLLGGGDGVAVVVGRAGTGKTFALDAARAGWMAAGMRVIGAAPSARAAAELQAGSGIPSTTLARLLLDAERPADSGGGLPAGGVVVVDEAGMAGTRTLDRLVTLAGRSQTKVVLVGDPAQLPEIDAGGTFAALAHASGAPELVDNRRQAEAWERQALDRVRSGAPNILEVYRAHGRLVLADTAADARARLVADWWQAQLAGVDAGMWALRRADVDHLNRLARQAMADAGCLGPDTLSTGADRVFAVGDEIVCLRNDRRLGVLNGTRGRVAALHHDTGALTLTTTQGATVTLPGDYLDAGLADWGYALTVHKAQGVTVDRAFLLGSDQLYREAGYVGLSRGRLSNDLYLVAPDDTPTIDSRDVDTPGHALRPPRAVDDGGVDRHTLAIRTASSALATSRAQHLAGTTGAPAPNPGASLADLAGTARQTGAHLGGLSDSHPLAQAAAARRQLLRRAALADPGAHLATLGPPPPGGTARIAWANAAEAVDAYRDRWRITTPDLLGPTPADPAAARERAHAAAAAELAAIVTGRPTPSVDRGTVVDAASRPIDHDPDRSDGAGRAVRAERGDDRGWAR